MSEVGNATGLVGAAALTAALAYVIAGDGIDAIRATLLLFGAAAGVMILWEVLVERVHLRPTTGLDWSLRRPWDEVLSIAGTKMVGLVATFALMGLVYFSAKNYADPIFDPWLSLFQTSLLPIALVAPWYIVVTTRRMVEPLDGLWHFGKVVMLERAEADMPMVKNHLLSWGVKTFFLAFMVSIVPSQIEWLQNLDPAAFLQDPVPVILLLVQIAFLFDIVFATLGYVLTLRPLDSHIRSANPYLTGWLAALACYPPFALMMGGGPLDYRSGTEEWTFWFDGQPLLLVLWGGTILALTSVYAWATVIFGIRFSNLTHRGIITTGPYRFVRHPAYLCKNITWWMIHMPFLTLEGGALALQNCVLLVVVNLLYFARAKTEERHLLADPRYEAYHAWTAQHGLVARLARIVRRPFQGRPTAASSATEG